MSKVIRIFTSFNHSKNHTMQKPTIELKKVKTFIGREGHGLNADLYINGVKTAFVRDDASGGGVDYDVINKEMFDLVNAYAKSLPAEPIDFGAGPVRGEDGKIMMLDVTLDQLIDDVFNEMERAKTDAKIKKKFVNTLVFGKKGGDRFFEVKYKIPLASIPKEHLQKEIEKFKAKYANEFKSGEYVFFNDNLDALGVKG